MVAYGAGYGACRTGQKRKGVDSPKTGRKSIFQNRFPHKIFCFLERFPVCTGCWHWQAAARSQATFAWLEEIDSLLINSPCQLHFIQYIYFMEPHYKTLQTIFNITKEDPQPCTYKCRPREIILRQFQDWSVIQQHLDLLEAEELINTRQEETLVILITVAGIEKIKRDAVTA